MYAKHLKSVLIHQQRDNNSVVVSSWGQLTTKLQYTYPNTHCIAIIRAVYSNYGTHDTARVSGNVDPACPSHTCLCWCRAGYQPRWCMRSHSLLPRGTKVGGGATWGPHVLRTEKICDDTISVPHHIRRAHHRSLKSAAHSPSTTRAAS